MSNEPRREGRSWRSVGELDAAWVRSLVVDSNDGIIATAGIVEGFVGAGATGRALPIAAFVAMVAGGISLAGAKFAEEATERDAEQAVIEEERRQLELSPDEEFAELEALYEAKGLSNELALAVATELTAKDALAAHADAEHGVELHAPRRSPLVAAAASGVAFALGASVPLLAVVLFPDEWRELVTYAAVIFSLGLTSLILVAAGSTHVLRTLIRAVLIGTATLLLTLAGGSLFHP